MLLTRTLSHSPLALASGGWVSKVHEKAKLFHLGLRHRQLRKLAEQSPIATNELLSPEHITYAMAWKQLVNPKSKPLTVLHTAPVADVSSVLLHTNATRVIVVNPTVPRIKNLRSFWPYWQQIDSNGTFNFNFNQLYAGGWKDPLEELQSHVKSEFQKDLKAHRDLGYWSDADIKKWSLDRLVVVNLKRMGVDPYRIWVQNWETSPDQVLDVTRLVYDWAYPGELVQLRTIDYVKSEISNLFTGPLHTRLLEIHGLYQKALADSAHTNDALVQNVQDRLLEGGFILMGDNTPTNQRKGADMRPKPLANLAPHFKPLTLPDVYNNLMGQSNSFGWKLYGAQHRG